MSGFTWPEYFKSTDRTVEATKNTRRGTIVIIPREEG